MAHVLGYALGPHKNSRLVLVVACHPREETHMPLHFCKTGWKQCMTKVCLLYSKNKVFWKPRGRKDPSIWTPERFIAGKWHIESHALERESEHLGLDNYKGKRQRPESHVRAGEHSQLEESEWMWQLLKGRWENRSQGHCRGSICETNANCFILQW
jgi:hypothetical protein